jgi:hypothetical protein
VKTIDLATAPTSIEEIFHLAGQQHLFVHTPDGKVFIVAAVEPDDAGDTFANEVARTRHNAALRVLLAERSQAPRSEDIHLTRYAKTLG